jgi:hypothetical protein
MSFAAAFLARQLEQTVTGPMWHGDAHGELVAHGAHRAGQIALLKKALRKGGTMLTSRRVGSSVEDAHLPALGCRRRREYGTRRCRVRRTGW